MVSKSATKVQARIGVFNVSSMANNFSQIIDKSTKKRYG